MKKKKFLTKKGITFEVELSTSKNSVNKEQRHITIFSLGERIADVVEDGTNSHVNNISKKLDFYEVLAIAEVVENFEQYFYLLNQ